MEEENTLKPYVTSDKFFNSRSDVYYYGLRTFGYFQAERYECSKNTTVKQKSYRNFNSYASA